MVSHDFHAISYARIFMNIPFKNNHRMFIIPHCEKEINNVHCNETKNVHHWDIFGWKIIEKLD